MRKRMVNFSKVALLAAIGVFVFNRATRAGYDSPESSGVESASYDPPFTPGPLRRNEVLIRLKSER